MSVVYPEFQEFFSLPDNTTIGITRANIPEASNQIPIAPGLATPQGAASCQLIDTGDVLQSVTGGQFYINNSTGYVTVNATADKQGKKITLVSYHRAGNSL